MAYERRPQHLEWHARLNARLLQPQRAAAGTVEQGWLPPLPIRKVGWFGLPLYEALVMVTVMNGRRQWHFQKIWGYRRAVQYMKRSPWPGMSTLKR
jgi:hypothetical protein